MTEKAQPLDAQALFPHGIAGVIFDCDGVMIDSRAANNIFYNRVLAYFGLPPMTQEQEDYSFMATSRQALLHIVPPHLHHEIDYVTRNEVVYQRDIVPMLRLQPGFMNFIDNLRSRGVRGTYVLYGSALRNTFCLLATASTTKRLPEGRE